MGIADDIVVCGSTKPEHDQAFCKMLEATRKHKRLTSEKLEFKQTQVDFLGHVLTENGIQLAKEKLEAIRNMKTPSNMTELQTILGMVTYLNRFSTKLADLISPLRELAKKHVHFSWEYHHQQAFDEIKKNCAHPSSSPIMTQIQLCPRFFSAMEAKQVSEPGWDS